MVVGAQTSSVLTIFEQQSFKEKCKEFCDKNGILAYFPTFESLFPFAAISFVKPKVSQAENVAVILCDPNGNTRHILTRIGPKFNVMAINRFDYSENPSILREKILEENCKFNQIILLAVSPPMKSLSHIREIANALTGQNVTIINKAIFDLLPEISVDYVRHLNREKSTEFFVVPYCKEKFVVKVGGSSVIEWDGIYQNPFEESVKVKVTPKNIVILEGGEPNDLKLLKRQRLAIFKSDEVKITFKIDTNFFYEFKIEPIRAAAVEVPSPQVCEQEKGEKTSKFKARMVVSENDFSVLIFENGKKKLLKYSNGSTKIPLYISFAEDKPVVGEAAKKVLKEKPSFVVYDLVKLCQLENVKDKDPKWKFKLTKDTKIGILIELDTFRGRRKSEMDFLVAILFQNCLKLVRDEIGENPNELEIESKGLKNPNNLIFTFLKAAERIQIKLLFV